jgi:hypothetical protein
MAVFRFEFCADLTLLSDKSLTLRKRPSLTLTRRTFSWRAPRGVGPVIDRLGWQLSMCGGAADYGRRAPGPTRADDLLARKPPNSSLAHWPSPDHSDAATGSGLGMTFSCST